MQPRCEWYRIQLEMTMQAAPVAPVAPVAEPGTITLELRVLDSRLVQLRRLAEIRRARRELLAEQQVLEVELFGPFWPDQRAVDPS